MKKSKTQQQKWIARKTTGAENQELGNTKAQIRDFSAETTKGNMNRKQNTSITSPTNWRNCWKTLWGKRNEDRTIRIRRRIRKQQTETHPNKGKENHPTRKANTHLKTWETIYPAN